MLSLSTPTPHSRKEYLELCQKRWHEFILKNRNYYVFYIRPSSSKDISIYSKVNTELGKNYFQKLEEKKCPYAILLAYQSDDSIRFGWAFKHPTEKWDKHYGLNTAINKSLDLPPLTVNEIDKILNHEWLKKTKNRKLVQAVRIFFERCKKKYQTGVRSGMSENLSNEIVYDVINKLFPKKGSR